MHLFLPEQYASWISLAATALVFLLLRLRIIPESAVRFTERKLRSLANHPGLLLLLIPSLSFTVNATIALKNGIPRPRVQDEFSYLLAADTFSHGRMTNPTPAFWEHFETPHELMQPTYMSKYPPAQGLALALGQITIRLPIVGVWLTTAAACGAIYWMLLGFVSRPWALVGGIMAVLHPLLIHWSQIYWGGSVAALGGALVLGACARLMLQSTSTAAVVLAIGLTILANSRPFEGFILSMPLLAILIWRRRKNPALLIPLCSILLPAAACMGYDNYQITGHVFRSPYQQYIQQYDVYPKFWFLPKLPQPVYHDDLMRQFHTDYERADYDLLRTPLGFLKVALDRFALLLDTHANPWILILPILASLYIIKDNTLRWIWITTAVFITGLLAGKIFLPHYAAPLTPAFFLLITLGLRQLTQWKKFGRLLCLSILAGFITAASISASAPPDADSKRTGQFELIQQYLPLQSGKHLIFVAYTPDHLIHDEWVYNPADLENARIIWARHLGSQKDVPLAKHFEDRKIWLLTVGKSELRLTEYLPAR